MFSCHQKRSKKKPWSTGIRSSYCLSQPISAQISVTDFFTEQLLTCPPEYEEAEDALSLQRAEETLQLELGLGAEDLCALREDCAWVKCLLFWRFCSLNAVSSIGVSVELWNFYFFTFAEKVVLVHSSRIEQWFPFLSLTSKFCL